jgi:hypothetical protein
MKCGQRLQAFSWSASNGGCLPVFRGVYGGGKHIGRVGRHSFYSEIEDLKEGC